MKVAMIGVDLAKRVVQLHGASMAGHVKFRKEAPRCLMHSASGRLADLGEEAPRSNRSRWPPRVRGHRPEAARSP